MASAATARAGLEALLRERKLDRTVTTQNPAGIRESLSTGIADLDARLDGGLPRGEVSEICGPRSSGRGSIVQSILAAVTGEGGLAALVDPLDMFDPPHAGEAGVLLERLLWVRGESSAADRFEILLDRGLKSVNLVLQAGGFDVVVFDLAEVPHEAIRRLPFTTWFRLQRAIEGGRTACVLTGPAPISRSAGGVTIQLARGNGSSFEAGFASGAGVRARRLAGLSIEARILRARQQDTSACVISASDQGSAKPEA